MGVTRKIISNDYALLAVFVTIWLVFVFSQLDAKAIIPDEGYSLYVANLPLSAIVPTLGASDVHPPLYYLLLHGWIGLFGASDFAARSLSVIFGAGAILMTYAVGRSLFDHKVGLLSALLVSVSAVLFSLSQEARMYTLMVLLVLVSTYFFIRFIRRADAVASVGYVLATTLLLYTHNYALFFVIAQNIFVVTFLFLRPRDHPVHPLRWFTLQGVLLLLFAPWLLVFVQQASAVGHGFHTGSITPTLLHFVGAFAYFAGSLTYFMGSYVLFAIFAILSCFALLEYKRRDDKSFLGSITSISGLKRIIRFRNVNEVYFLLLWLVIPVVIPFVISLVSVSIYNWRYASAAAVAFYLLVAAGIPRVRHKGVRIGVICVIIILSLASIQAYAALPGPTTKSLMHDLDAAAISGDLVAVFPTADKIYGIDHYNTRTDITIVGVEADTQQVNQTVQNHDRLWFVQSPSEAEEIGNFTSVKETLLKQYHVAYFQKYGDFELYLLMR